MKNLVIGRLLPYGVLTLIVLISHGWLIFNHSTNWDDWLIKGFLDDGNWSDLRNMTSEMGLPILAYFFWSLKLLGLSDSYKLVSLCLIFLSSLVTFEIGLRSGWLYRSEALLIAVIAAVYPAFQTSILLSTLQYEFFYFLFLLAVLVYLISAKEPPNSRLRFLLLGLSLILFFVSFNLNSLLLYYFVFLICLILNEDQVMGMVCLRKLQFAIRYRMHFVILPFVYWGMKKVLFPTHGLYANYNRLRFEGTRLEFEESIGRVAEAIQVEVFTPVQAAIGYLSEFPIFPLLIFSASCAVYLIFLRKISREQVQKLGKLKRLNIMLMISVALLICGIVPYVVVGHIPSRSGWDSRHAILAGLPVAILLTATTRWIYWTSTSQTQLMRATLSVISTFVGSILIVGFVISTTSYYAAHQLRAIKDESVMAKLQNQDSLKDFSIFWIDDRFFIPGSATYYNFYEWSSIFNTIWRGQSRVGIQLQYKGGLLPHVLPAKLFQTSRYNLADFNPEGRQACLTIQPGVPQFSESKLIQRYLLLQVQSWFGGEKYQTEKRAFLQEVTLVGVEELRSATPLKGCLDIG